jgi:hypothetical protein
MLTPSRRLGESVMATSLRGAPPTSAYIAGYSYIDRFGQIGATYKF